MQEQLISVPEAQLVEPDYSPISLKQLDQILRVEHGVEALPTELKRSYTFREDGLRRLFGEDPETLAVVGQHIGIIERYYRGRPVKDKYGDDHQKRRDIREDLRLDYGEAFLNDPYMSENQFSANLMMKVFNSLETLSDLAADAGKDYLSYCLTTIADALNFYDDRSLAEDGSFAYAYGHCRSEEAKLIYVGLYRFGCEASLSLLDDAQKAEAPQKLVA